MVLRNRHCDEFSEEALGARQSPPQVGDCFTALRFVRNDAMKHKQTYFAVY